MAPRHLVPAGAVLLVVAGVGGLPAALAQEDENGQVSGIDPEDFILDIEATILDIETGTRTTESAQEVTITLDADVFFDFDQHELRADARETLARVADQIEDDEAAELAIAGHTDSDGSDQYNQGLSERRAAAVEDFLAGELDGVSMTVEGFGESQPVAPNATDEGRALNRRVEITYPQ